MTTWIQNFLDQIDAIDLSKKDQTRKTFDKKSETVLGELSEYHQKIWRLREEARLGVEYFREQIEDLKEVHKTEESLGLSTVETRAAHSIKAKDLFGKFKAVFIPYMTINHIFSNELEIAFFLEMTQFPVKGIREGKLLIGREDDTREDEDTLIEFFLKIELILELEQFMKS